jgi:hypothetical protein
LDYVEVRVLQLRLLLIEGCSPETKHLYITPILCVEQFPAPIIKARLGWVHATGMPISSIAQCCHVLQSTMCATPKKQPPDVHGDQVSYRPFSCIHGRTYSHSSQSIFTFCTIVSRCFMCHKSIALLSCAGCSVHHYRANLYRTGGWMRRTVAIPGMPVLMSLTSKSCLSLPSGIPLIHLSRCCSQCCPVTLYALSNTFRF